MLYSEKIVKMIFTNTSIVTNNKIKIFFLPNYSSKKLLQKENLRAALSLLIRWHKLSLFKKILKLKTTFCVPSMPIDMSMKFC